MAIILESFKTKVVIKNSKFVEYSLNILILLSVIATVERFEALI